MPCSYPSSHLQQEYVYATGVVHVSHAVLALAPGSKGVKDVGSQIVLGFWVHPDVAAAGACFCAIALASPWKWASLTHE